MQKVEIENNEQQQEHALPLCSPLSLLLFFSLASSDERCKSRPTIYFIFLI